MGFNNGRRYHFALWLCALICVLAYFQMTDTAMVRWWPVFIVLLLGLHLVKVMKTNNPRELDPLLKVVALSSFLFSCLLLLS
jgi:1,4-dihydroxy-2-naphthoate octaprenyltransferase